MDVLFIVLIILAILGGPWIYAAWIGKRRREELLELEQRLSKRREADIQVRQALQLRIDRLEARLRDAAPETHADITEVTAPPVIESPPIQIEEPEPVVKSAEVRPEADEPAWQPAPQLTSNDEPPPLLPAEPATQKFIATLEQTLGTRWLSKIGIVILVIGIALFLAYQIREMGPGGKILVGFLVSASLLGSGIFYERHERYTILAHAGVGGGWALAFFTTYAMHHVQASRIISSESADLVLMFIVGMFMVLHTLQYDSEIVTGLAFLLASTTVTISHVDSFSLSANAILAAGFALVVARKRWFELEIFGILATYLNHFWWIYSQKGHSPTTNTALLFVY